MDIKLGGREMATVVYSNEEDDMCSLVIDGEEYVEDEERAIIPKAVLKQIRVEDIPDNFQIEVCESKDFSVIMVSVPMTFIKVGKNEIMNVFEYEYEYETKDKNGKKQIIRFRWITSLGLTKRNIEEMILSGRGRWKIENEGFNNQKNGIYRIEHLNSKNSNAMKNHYLLTQISDILMQLYLAWNPYVKKLKQTIKNTSSGLLESFRRQTVTKEDVSYIFRYTTVYLE